MAETEGKAKTGNDIEERHVFTAQAAHIDKSRSASVYLRKT
jgi:hypothetical protein